MLSTWVPPLRVESQVYNVFALVLLGSAVSNQLILREKSPRREGRESAVRLARRIAEQVPRCCPIQPKVSQFMSNQSVFVLGAGFSCLAGIPLMNELRDEVLADPAHPKSACACGPRRNGAVLRKYCSTFERRRTNPRHKPMMHC